MAVSFRHTLYATCLVGGALFNWHAGGAPIDDFSVSQTAAADASNDGAFSGSTQPGPIGGTVVPAGGVREIGVSKENDSVGGVEAEVFPGALLYDAIGSVVGQLFVRYDGLGGIDLSGFDTLTITGLIDTSAAAGAGTTLGITIEDGSANMASSSFTLNMEGPFVEEIPLINFAAVDLFDVSRIALGTFDDDGIFIDVPPGGDITLTRFEAVTAVPEPASSLVWTIVAGVVCIVLRNSWRGRCTSRKEGDR